LIRRRLVATTVILATLGSLSVSLAAPAGATPRQLANLSANGRPWVCVAVDELNFGYCQYDPLA
jgi:hypothetical protein